MTRFASQCLSRLNRIRTFLILVATFSPLPVQAATSETVESCVLIDIHEIGWSRLEEIKSIEDTAWWIELDRVLLVCGSDIAIARIGGLSQILSPLDGLILEELWVTRGFHELELAARDQEVIAESGGVAIVRSLDPALGGLADSDAVGAPRGEFGPATPDTALMRQAANKPPRGRVMFAPEVQGLVDLVDADRWFADVETLASFNRYTHNSGIHDARAWLVSQFAALPGLQVTTPSFNADGTTAYNIIATLVGLTRPEEWYIIGAHYDSISGNPQVAAPGAEDNGTGCAGVLEMARILTAYPPDATVMFICYSAEELGLLGSKDHVDDVIAAGDLDKIQTMLNLDMIGFTSDNDLDCKLETDPFAVSLFDIFEDAALQFTTLRIVTDDEACCSDHKPYLREDVPALLTIENDWFQYPFYHTTNDLPEHITLAMGREILKMNVAAMAQLIGAPEPAVFADGFESGDTSLWTLTLP